MLKLNYTDVGLFMERTMINPELLIAQRVLLAMRLERLPRRGNCFSPLYVEPGHASFLLPADLPELEGLEIVLQQECNPSATVFPVDNDFVEVNFSGNWVAESKEAHEGMFLTVMSGRLSVSIYKLWQMSEVYISSPA
ncbi:MAG: hypothetical protein SFY66_10390 [Oculatellaceae cyanobacterium bins.114]|nr:hypothetical protein [Oculatellaceae cyanobacterium bins.114]